MAIKLGIVMDPIQSIKIKKDSSFAMLLEAQRRGYELYYMEMDDLYMEQGQAFATMRTLSVWDNSESWFEFGELLDQPLAEPTEELKLNLHPRAPYSINTLPEPSHGIRLLIGPEGGLSAAEIEQAREQGFADMLLGPRVLRTETAGLTAITALQCRFGDLA